MTHRNAAGIPRPQEAPLPLSLKSFRTFRAAYPAQAAFEGKPQNPEGTRVRNGSERFESKKELFLQCPGVSSLSLSYRKAPQKGFSKKDKIP